MTSGNYKFVEILVKGGAILDLTNKKEREAFEHVVNKLNGADIKILNKVINKVDKDQASTILQTKLESLSGSRLLGDRVLRGFLSKKIRQIKTENIETPKNIIGKPSHSKVVPVELSRS